MNPRINQNQRAGKRLSQNHIKVQQLKNRQFIITLPHMWAEILTLKKGSVITFVPGEHGGVEIIKSEKK